MINSEILVYDLDAIDRVLRPSDPSKYGTVDLQRRISAAQTLIARLRASIIEGG